jgi:diguanylate cyclase (GGDEF)-like protein
MINIIVVEDSETSLNSLLLEFKNYPDINVLVAKNYNQATKILRQEHQNIQFAILDLNLPDASSDKVVALFNSHHIPSLVLTAMLSNELRDEVFKKDVVDYVIKNGKSSVSYAIKKAHSFVKEHPNSILIVDDSKLYREKIRHALRHLNIKILEAQDGAEALEMVNESENNITLMVTDFNMPNMDGLELAMKIRSIYTRDEFAIIAASSIDDRETIKKFIKIGANDFIIKPFNDDEVLIKVHAALELLELFQKTKDLANRDFLTGAYNRRHFFDAGEAIFSKALRKKKDVAVATFDIDNFKNINDTYGHDIGDIAIKEMSKIINKNLRKSDLAARFGGEEFCVLLEDIDLQNTEALFEKIRASFEKNQLPTEGIIISYTVSIGVAYGLSDSLDEMIKISDQALYEAKKSGKNRVVIHTP